MRAALHDHSTRARSIPTARPSDISWIDVLYSVNMQRIAEVRMKLFIDDADRRRPPPVPFDAYCTRPNIFVLQDHQRNECHSDDANTLLAFVSPNDIPQIQKDLYPQHRWCAVLHDSQGVLDLYETLRFSEGVLKFVVIRCRWGLSARSFSVLLTILRVSIAYYVFTPSTASPFGLGWCLGSCLWRAEPDSLLLSTL